MKKLVLTGAAGRLSSYLREPLTQLCDALVSTDIVDDIGTLYEGESYIKGDLANINDMMRVLENGLKVRMIPTLHKTFAVDTKEDLIKVEHIMGSKLG